MAIKISNQNDPIPLRDEFERWYATEVIPVQQALIEKRVAGLDPNEASDLVFRRMNYINDEFKEDFWHDFLSQINPKDLTDMAKIKRGFTAFNEMYSKERAAEWSKYALWLDSYFLRNPGHSLTDGRRKCAVAFGVAVKTIQRHTKGYVKPKS